MKKIKQVVMILLVFTIGGCGYAEKQEKQKRELKERQEAISLKKELREALIRESIRVQDSIQKETLRVKKETLRVKKEIEIKNSLSNVTFSLSSPNSAGGRDVRFYYINKSNKVIKYLTWSGSFKNAVGDNVSCTIRRNYYTYGGKDTGPVKQYERGGGFWGNFIYNYQATKMELSEINIEYMDGSKLEIKGDELLLIGLKEYQIEQP